MSGDQAQPAPAMRPNAATDEGRALGREIARLCDGELTGKRDDRCRTCAFRTGDHLANGSPETLMTALKCAMEGEPFWCHETDRACAGWAAMRAPKGAAIAVPWESIEGGNYQAGDVIPLPDQSKSIAEQSYR